MTKTVVGPLEQMFADVSDTGNNEAVRNVKQTVPLGYTSNTNALIQQPLTPHIVSVTLFDLFQEL